MTRRNKSPEDYAREAVAEACTVCVGTATHDDQVAWVNAGCPSECHCDADRKRRAKGAR